jgi:uncharacterized protein YbbC (DUF1343 family)
VAAEGFGRWSGLRVGLIANRASTVGRRSLIDLVHEAPDVELAAIFAPEHGLRAEEPAGAEVGGGVDPVTGVVVHSLYGEDRAPTSEALEGLDLVVFDLQDVGARFYTYTATMGLAMQAAARAGLPFVVLDRPNPLGGHRPDGPVRDGANESFVSPYPVPSLHGLTPGELALAIRGEGWLDGLEGLDLDVVPMQGWDRGDHWDRTGLPWVPPSPGLATAETALTYPATVLLEATTVSYGQGTDRTFAQFGAPWLDAEALAADLAGAGLAGVRFEAVTFLPEAGPAAPEPRFEGRTVPGVRLEITDVDTVRPMEIAVHLLHHLLAQAGDREIIERPGFFDLLAGRSALRRALLAGEDPATVVASWDADLRQWEALRSRYLLY